MKNLKRSPFKLCLLAALLGGAVCSSSAATFTAVADARIYEQSANSNFGDQTFLSVFTDTGNVQRSIVLFNLSELEADPPDIVSATLILEANNFGLPAAGNPDGIATEVWRLTSGWGEDTVTWNNPWTTPGGNFVGTAASGGVDPYAVNSEPVAHDHGTTLLEWDVTELVQGWVDGTFVNNGLLLKSAGNGNFLHFSSSELGGGSTPPTLEIEFAPVPEPIHATVLSALALLGFGLYRRIRS